MAHFELQAAAEAPGEDGTTASAGAEAPAAGPGGAASSGVGFWESLLSGRWAAAQAAEQADLGKGKRQRRKVLATLNQDALLDELVGDGSEEGEGGSDARGRRGSASSGDRSGAVGTGAGGQADSSAHVACCSCSWGRGRPSTHLPPPPTLYLSTPHTATAADDEYQVGSDEDEEERREAEDERQAALLLVRGREGTALH